MRKYLSSVLSGSPLMQTKIASNDAHWLIYSALVDGAAGYFSFDDVCDLKSCILKRDVARLLSTCARIDGYLTVYGDQLDISTIRAHRQVVCFLKKYPFSQNEYDNDRALVAKKKFLAAELDCDRTNARLRGISNDDLPRWVCHAQRLIGEVLGELTGAKVMKILNSGNHGPGATRSTKGNRTTPYYKFMDFPYSCTKRALPYATAAISMDPAWLDILESSGLRRTIPCPQTPVYQREMQIVSCCTEIEDSDSVTFVPKDAKTDRPIAVGASLNMYLQLGVKEYMEKALQRVGVDLTDQTRNQQYALLGSKFSTGSYENNPKQFSTIDLASASDTISFELVKLMLDPEWFAFLCDLRHESGILDGETYVYHKFSAMGNGFTFPLESLIFWACSKAALDCQGLPSGINDLTVYGDDIICRLEGFTHVVDALTWSGFTLNQEKSFRDGPFKESCGADYYKGHDVRPFYLKREVINYEDIYFICNSIADKIHSHGSHIGYQAMFKTAITLIPCAKRRFIPLNSDDDCGLAVPYSYYRKIIRNPLMYDSEHRLLGKSKYLDLDSVILTDPFYIRESLSALQYSGRGKTKLYLVLRATPPTMHALPGRVLEARAAARGVITRRDSTRVNIRVCTISSWNGTYSSHQIVSHPINWI